MLYKPKYCCNCGESIERVEWKLTASRKFCEFCETEFKFDEIFPKIICGLLVVFGLWGFSSSFLQPETGIVIEDKVSQSNIRQKSSRSLKTTNLDSKSDKSYSSGLEQKSSTFQKSEQTTQKKLASQQDDFSKRSLKDSKSSITKQKKPQEAVYYCGAETKKGNPCSRRVKGGGRCWQHKNKEALLSATELKVNKK